MRDCCGPIRARMGCGWSRRLENARGIDALAPDDMLVAWRNRLVPLHERAAAPHMRAAS